MKRNYLPFSLKVCINTIAGICVMMSSLTMRAQDNGVSINNTGNPPDPSAMLDVTSSEKGILIPRISMINLPVAPAPGLLIYIVDVDPGFWYFDGGGWRKLMRTVDQKWFGSPDIYFMGGRAGIGTIYPSAILDLENSGSTGDGLDINNTGSGDPQVSFQLGGVSKYTMGIDNSDLDKFKIGGSALSPTTKITITEAGDIGIGTESPTSRMDVESNDNTATNIDINNTSATGDPQVKFQVSGTTKFTVGVDNSDADKFKIGTTAVSTSARMTISSTGEVGLGTEAPSATLHLNGTAKVLGPWEAKTQGVDYLAATDGFVIAGVIINSGSPDANAGLKGYTDNLTHPVAIRGLACVRKIAPGTQNGQDSFTMPVRKGNYWRVEYDYIEGSVSYSIEFIPFGTNNP